LMVKPPFLMDFSIYGYHSWMKKMENSPHVLFPGSALDPLMVV